MTSATADFPLIRIASDKNDTAIAWADLAHRGVMRKATPVQYFTHLAAVAHYMAGAGGDRNEVAAAYLHDIIEDSQDLPDLPVGATGPDGQPLPRRVTYEDLRGEFGATCAGLVRAVTKGPEMRGVPLERHAEVIIAKLRGEGPSAVALKGCDLLHNTSCVVHDYEKRGVDGWAGTFGERRWHRKVRHYVRLADLIAGDLRGHDRWGRLADAVAFRARELEALLREALEHTGRAAYIGPPGGCVRVGHWYGRAVTLAQTWIYEYVAVKVDRADADKAVEALNALLASVDWNEFTDPAYANDEDAEAGEPVEVVASFGYPKPDRVPLAEHHENAPGWIPYVERARLDLETDRGLDLEDMVRESLSENGTTPLSVTVQRSEEGPDGVIRELGDHKAIARELERTSRLNPLSMP